jgi:hypothetical protein
MNETLQLVFGLKMSPTPGKENKRLDWLPHKGSGSSPPTPLERQSGHLLVTCHVQISGSSPVLFSPH